MLETEYVADKVIEAILTNQEILMMPRIMYMFAAMKKLVIIYLIKFRIFFKLDFYFGKKSYTASSDALSWKSDGIR